MDLRNVFSTTELMDEGVPSLEHDRILEESELGSDSLDPENGVRPSITELRRRPSGDAGRDPGLDPLSNCDTISRTLFLLDDLDRAASACS